MLVLLQRRNTHWAMTLKWVYLILYEISLQVDFSAPPIGSKSVRVYILAGIVTILGK